MININSNCNPIPLPFLLSVVLLGEVGRVAGHEALGALKPVQAEDGDGGHEEGEGPTLDDGQATAEDDLEQRDQAGDKQDGGDDVAAGRVIIPDAEQWAQDEGDGDGRPEHSEVVLQPQHAARVPEARSVVNNDIYFSDGKCLLICILLH